MTLNSKLSYKNRLDLDMGVATDWCLVYCIMVSGHRTRDIWSPEYHHTLHCIPACMPMWRERNLVRSRLGLAGLAW